VDSCLEKVLSLVSCFLLHYFTLVSSKAWSVKLLLINKKGKSASFFKRKKIYLNVNLRVVSIEPRLLNSNFEKPRLYF
jgi:hypothetical protein